MFIFKVALLGVVIQSALSCFSTKATSTAVVANSAVTAASASCSLPFSVFNNGKVVPEVSADPITATSGDTVTVTCKTSDTNTADCNLALNIQDGVFVGACSTLGQCTAILSCDNGVFSVQGAEIESITCGCHTLTTG